MAARRRHHRHRAPSIALTVAIVIAATFVGAPSAAALDAETEIPVQITVRQPADVQFLDDVTIDAWLDPIPPAGFVWARIGNGAAAPLEKARGNRFTGRLQANGAIGHNVVTVTVEGAPYTATPAVTSLEVMPIPTVTTLTVAPTDPIPGATFRLQAKVAVAHPCCGYDPSDKVQFFAWTGGTSTYLGTGTLDSVNVAKLDRPGLPAGTYTFSARYLGYLYLGPSDSAKVTVDVAKASSSVVLTPPPTTQTHRQIAMTAAVTARSGWADGATITFVSDDPTDPGCVVAASTSSAATCTIASLPPGTYTYQAMYSGNATIAPSSSVKKTFIVTEDTVEATDVGVDTSTFYPVVDGYRDVLTITGTRAEKVGVANDIQLADCGHCPTSILEAAITAWVRLSTPSFCRIAETCAFTVASETPSS